MKKSDLVVGEIYGVSRMRRNLHNRRPYRLASTEAYVKVRGGRRPLSAVPSYMGRGDGVPMVCIEGDDLVTLKVLDLSEVDLCSTGWQMIGDAKVYVNLFPTSAICDTWANTLIDRQKDAEALARRLQAQAEAKQARTAKEARIVAAAAALGIPASKGSLSPIGWSHWPLNESDPNFRAEIDAEVLADLLERLVKAEGGQ